MTDDRPTFRELFDAYMRHYDRAIPPFDVDAGLARLHAAIEAQEAFDSPVPPPDAQS